MIEDDNEIAELLEEYLFQHNIKITNFETPELGISGLRLQKYDLVILDLSLPEMDGIEVCKLIREKSNIPIIISSARSDITDKTKCFELGADDYLPKPYDSQELVLRIHSILRRNKLTINEVQNTKKIFEIRDDKHAIFKNSQPIELTNAEYNILKYLIKKEECAVSREELLLNVESIKYDSTYKSIDVLIGRIRGKIEENQKQPKYIISLRGIGYKLVNTTNTNE